ncbi:MAG: hypothetical protein GY722_20415 [bacterium]|nr:hypothetical protein [bacterium]
MNSVVAQATGAAENEELIWILAFGVVILLIFTLIYMWRKGVNVTFARLYGLIVIAVIASALAFAEVTDEARTAAFTLLGTIAGYLAGARAASGEAPAAVEGGSPIKSPESAYLA